MIRIIERATRTVRCACGALLEYTHESVRRDMPPPSRLVEPMHRGVQRGWPWIPCPEEGCGRAVLVSGVM